MGYRPLDSFSPPSRLNTNEGNSSLSLALASTCSMNQENTAFSLKNFYDLVNLMPSGHILIVMYDYIISSSLFPLIHLYHSFFSELSF